MLLALPTYSWTYHIMQCVWAYITAGHPPDVAQRQEARRAHALDDAGAVAPAVNHIHRHTGDAVGVDVKQLACMHGSTTCVSGVGDARVMFDASIAYTPQHACVLCCLAAGQALMCEHWMLQPSMRGACHASGCAVGNSSSLMLARCGAAATPLAAAAPAVAGPSPSW